MATLKVGVIFAHRPSGEATWPRIGYDYDNRSKYLLKAIRRALPEAELLVFHASSPEECKRILEEMNKDVLGYVVYIIGIWTGVPELVARTGKPTVLIDDLFGGSGEFLISMANLRKSNLPCVGVSSSSIAEIVETVRLLGVIYKLRNSRILVVRDPKLKIKTYDPTRCDKRGHFSEEYLRICRETFGVDIVTITPEDLMKVYENVSESSAMELAKQWNERALKVVDVPFNEILKSAKLHIALTELAKNYKANAVSVDCLALFYVGKLPAYPCLSHMEMLNKGMVGTCEADMDSAVTQLIASYLTGRPGFISDPVIDTATGTITYAHCVAPTKLWGAVGHEIPYVIMSHAEDRKGASIRALYPPGEKVTTFKVNVKERAMCLHSGVIIGNSNEVDRGCRTKVIVKANVEAILSNWNKEVNFDWHRVTVVGDYRRQLKKLANLLGLKVIEEDVS